MRRRGARHPLLPLPTRIPRALCALLLCVGASAAVGAVPAGATAPTANPNGTTAAATALDQIVPAPASVRAGGAGFTLDGHTSINVAAGSKEANAVGRYLADVLRPSTGLALRMNRSAKQDDAIVLELGRHRSGSGPEGYELAINDRAVRIRAERPEGLFHGVQTLRQLLPASVEKKTRQSGTWTIPGGTVADTPRFSHRGAMLDVSRHFFTVDQVKTYIDQLALYKINTLHLHLSDDQGWRIAIDSRPRLTEVGGSTEVGGGPGGFYTKADYREIVQYAASRFLTIVPEIDMPGHVNAALASYAELNCDGVAPPLYTGTDVGFSSLCVPKEVTYQFLDEVIGELAAMTPGPYLHIGGDEAHATSHADYVALMDRAQQIVRKYGKTVVGWHQLTGAHPVAGAVAQYWGLDGSEAEVAAAAKAGTKIIMSPANHTYLDMKYDKNTPLGLSWAGLIEVDKAYNWDPTTFIKGAPASSILGVEAPLWAETLTTSDNIEFMAFPRLPAIAELGWSPASSHDWNSFRERLAQQGPRWTALGINFYRSPQIPWPAE